ncbi:MAG: hypothetical protein ACI9E1_000602 [Cryomorphaceae bacterium]|jgi:hypothetical protein
MQHHVYFWLKAEHQTDAARAELEIGLSDMAGNTHVAKGGWGKPAATADRPVTDKTWDYALYCSFETLADHNAYQIDPDHDVFSSSHKHRWEKVMVMDAE